MAAFDTRKYCLEHKLSSFSLKLTWNPLTQKKELESVKWSKITPDNFPSFHDHTKNGFAILTGANDLVVVDCDIAKAKGEFPQDCLDTLEAACHSVVKTPNGKHYYFRCSKPLKKQTGAFWKGTQIPCLDVLADKSLILAPPSHYSRGDEVSTYRWERGDLSTLVELPDDVFLAIQKPQEEIKETLPIETLLAGLARSRFDSYQDWLKIGLVLYNEKLSWELWDTYSKQSASYEPGACQKKWATFSDSTEKITIKTLYMWLKEDNTSLFSKLQDNADHKFTLAAIDCHKTTAELFYLQSPDKYIFSPQLGWLTLQLNKTYKLSDKLPDKFLTDVADTVDSVVKEAIQYWTDLKKKAEDEDKRTFYENKIKACLNHQKKIRTTHYCQAVCVWLQDFYLDSSVVNKIDSKPSLLAFEDKVFDFSTCCFRPIDRSDYIMTTTGYDAPDLALPLDPHLESFLNSLFENEETLTCLLTCLAYSLGGNFLQLLFFFVGSGGNGKGMLNNLMDFCLGSYAFALPTPYITSKPEGKGAALPELANCKSARYVYASEPEAHEKLQIGFLKKISGGDKLTVRKLYKGEFSFRPQFTFFLLLNENKLSKLDLAIQRRLRVFEFPFLFKLQDDFVADNVKHRLADTTLDQFLQTKIARDSFMALLLRTYKAKVLGATDIPSAPEVKLATKNYLTEHNPISTWIYEYFTTNGDSTKKLTATDLCNFYRQDTSSTMTASSMGKYLSILGFCSSILDGKTYYRGIERKKILE